MSAIKHIDPKEFKEVGFLQEANRLFFHPHGLSLEMATLKEGDYEFPYTWIGIPASAVAALRVLLAGEPVEREMREKLAATLDEAREYNPGDCFIAGVADHREDPEDHEGLVFGEWDDASREKAERVKAERRRHYLHRARMFGQFAGDGLDTEADRIGKDAILASDLVADRDIEPTTFVEPRHARPAVEWEGDAQ